MNRLPSNRHVIARHWRGLVKPGLADRYINHLRTETLPQLSLIPGFITAAILRRETAGGTEFVILTRWESLDAIAAFAGRDVEVAVVPESVQQLMVEYDRRARHYEVMT